MYKRKKKILRVIRKSVLTGKAVWVSHTVTKEAERIAYKRACQKESMRVSHWWCTVARRKKNIRHLLSELTARLPILGDLTKEQRAAAKVLARMAEEEPSGQSDFYDHMCEERRLRKNAREREKRWREKYGNKNVNN